MRKAIVTRPFRRNEQDLSRGDEFECSDAEFAKWAGLGFVRGYETKVVAATEKKSSPSAPAAPASRKRTAKKRAKSATK